MTRPEDYDTKCKLYSDMMQCNKDEDRNVCINKTKAYTNWKVGPFTSTNCSKNREGVWKHSSSFSGGKSKRKSKKNKKSKRKTKKNKRKTRKNKRK